MSNSCGPGNSSADVSAQAFQLATLIGFGRYTGVQGRDSAKIPGVLGTQSGLNSLPLVVGVTHWGVYPTYTPVRFAVPVIFLVVAISSIQVLFPGPLPMWLLRNRKYIGLCFAVAMAWQGFFIFLMSNFHRAYYYENVYLLRDELEGTIGYIFLPAMVATSFDFGRKHFSSIQWKLIHKSSLYFLWAYAFSVLAAASGRQWQEPVTAFLTIPKWSADLVLCMPYWPFGPYLSLFIAGLGTAMLTKARTTAVVQTRN